MNYPESKEVFLTTWETNPKKRNKNNTITFVAPKAVVVVNNDTIISKSGGKYKIEEILVKQPSKLTGHIFYKAKSVFTI